MNREPLYGDSDRIENGGRRLGELAEHAGRIAGELKSTVDSLGPCWGEDEIGRSFAESHAAHAADTLDRAGALGDRIDAVGGRFVDTAATLRRLDEHGAATLRSADESRRSGRG